MFKALVTVAAIVWITAGLIVLPMPIPLGAIMIASGVVLLISVCAPAALYFKGFRQRHPDADRIIRVAEERLPASWRSILKRTDP